MAATSAPLIPGEIQFFSNAGAPLAGGLLYTYIPNTTTPKTTWQDAAQAIVNANPVTLDGFGRALVFGSGLYRLQLYDSSGNLIWDNLGEATDPNFVASAISVFTGDGGLGGTQGIVPAPPAGSGVAGYYLQAGGGWGPLLVVIPPTPSPTQAGFLFVPGRTITGSSGTLAPTDAASEVSFSNASVASVLNIPNDGSGWLATVATQIMVSNEIGSGNLTITPAAGVSLVWPGSSATPGNRVLAGNGQAILTHKRVSNLWTIVGAGVS